MKERNQKITFQQWLLRVAICLFGVQQTEKPVVKHDNHVQLKVPLDHQTSTNCVPYDHDKKSKPHKPQNDGRRRR